MPKTVYELRERTSAFADDARVDGSRIDLSRGVIKGPLRVLGLTSKNGKDYRPEAIRKALPLLENAAVYIDHPQGKSNARSLRDRFGRLKGLHQAADGSAWANELHFNPNHTDADFVAWWVKNDPKGIGLSINGDGYGSPDPHTRRAVIDEIARIHSVDLVDGPATVGGLFEQEGIMDNAALTDPAANAMAAPDATGTGGDHKDALAEAVSQLAAELKAGSCDHATAKKKINTILKLLAGEEQEAEAAPESEEGKKLTEQLLESPLSAVRWAGKQIRDGVLTRLIEQKLSASGLPANVVTDQFRVTLREAADPAKIDALIADRKAVLTTTPPAPGRKPPQQLPPNAPDLTPPKGTATGVELREQAANVDKSAVQEYLAKL